MPRKKEKELEDNIGEEIFKDLINKKDLTNKTAKKDHLIVQNEFRADIKKGDDLSDIPERYYETLKTEKII